MFLGCFCILSYSGTGVSTLQRETVARRVEFAAGITSLSDRVPVGSTCCLTAANNASSLLLIPPVSSACCVHPVSSACCVHPVDSACHVHNVLLDLPH